MNFILLHKRAATAPEKIHDCKTHIDPPGISGNLVEGRFYYDLFVYGRKAGRRVCGRDHGQQRYGAGRADDRGGRRRRSRQQRRDGVATPRTAPTRATA